MNPTRPIRFFIVIWLLMMTAFGSYFYFSPGATAAFIEPGAITIDDPTDWAYFMGMYRYFFGFSIGTALILLWVYPKPKEREQFFYMFLMINVVASLSRFLPTGFAELGSAVGWMMLFGEALFPAIFAWILWRSPKQLTEKI